MGSIQDDPAYIEAKAAGIPEGQRRLIVQLRRRRQAYIPNLRIGQGATVSARYMQFQARVQFFNALFGLVRDTTRDLANSEARAVEQRYRELLHDTLSRIDEQPGMARVMLAAMDNDPAYIEAKAAWDAFLNDWQARYHLPDTWVREYASATMNTAHAVWNVYGLPYNLPLDLSGATGPDIHDGLVDEEQNRDLMKRLRFTPEHRLVSHPVYLDTLKHPGHVQYDDSGEPIGEWEDDGYLGAVDRRTQTVDDMTDRILEMLRPRARRLAEAIAADGMALNNEFPPVTYRTAKPFEWLVRYQVCGESMRAIARSVGNGENAGHVSRTIRETAELIGLTIRPPERKGRPRKPRARTVKVLR